MIIQIDVHTFFVVLFGQSSISHDVFVVVVVVAMTSAACKHLAWIILITINISSSVELRHSQSMFPHHILCSVHPEIDGVYLEYI